MDRVSAQMAVDNAKADAWDRISSFASVAAASKGSADELENARRLISAIEKEKKKISRLIDDIPEEKVR